jgi:hypothetical protein
MIPEYRSYVLEFPNEKPFDKNECRQASFLGEFVRPLVEDQSRYIHYWSTYYGNHAKLRIYSNRHQEIEKELTALRDQLKLKPLDEEKHMSLLGDLGHKRFFGDKSESQPERRAFRILASLRAVTDLAIDSIYKRADGYWAFEENQDKNQNPIGNHLFSVTHLYHNVTNANAHVVMFQEQPGGPVDCLSYYYFHDRKQKGIIKPVTEVPREIQM